MHCAGGLLVDASLQVSETLTSSAALPQGFSLHQTGTEHPCKAHRGLSLKHSISEKCA